MTNEEAIELLKYKRMEINYKVNGITQFSKALDLAIKALEQEPCEDAISKHAVLETIDNRIEQIKRDADEINKSYSHLSFAEGVYDGYCRLKCDLWDLPSVTPKFTDDEVQKMQELEQAQLEKAYELGKAEIQPCEDVISKKDVMAIIEWAYDECKIDGYTDYCEIRDMVKGLQAVTPKAETITEFADRCRECGAKYGKLLEVRQKADGSSNEFFNFDSPMAKGESENEDMPSVTPQESENK